MHSPLGAVCSWKLRIYFSPILRSQVMYAHEKMLLLHYQYIWGQKDVTKTPSAEQNLPRVTLVLTYSHTSHKVSHTM